MAGMGPAPKADADRRRRNVPTFQWRVLPASGRMDPPPKLPEYRKWHPTTVATWNDWWRSPQSVAWDQSGRSLHRWAVLLDRLYSDADAPVSLHSEIVKIEDRHGMSDGALLKLRWMIVDEPAAPVVSLVQPATTKKRAAAKTKEDKDLLARMRAPR